MTDSLIRFVEIHRLHSRGTETYCGEEEDDDDDASGSTEWRKSQRDEGAQLFFFFSCLVNGM